MKRDLKVPSWLLKLLRWLCPADLSETIEGDVIEQFHNDVTRVGESRARLRAFLNTLDFVRIGIISRHKRSHIDGAHYSVNPVGVPVEAIIRAFNIDIDENQ